MHVFSSSLRIRLQPLLLSLALPLLAACGDDGPSGPNGGVDQNIKDIAVDLAVGETDVVDDNPQVTSAQGLKDAITGVTQTLPVASVVSASRRAALSLASTGAAHLVPRGVTCIWSLEQDGYVDDPQDQTAPQNGIRFRLYTLAGPGNPAAPLDDIGLIDVIPLQDGDQVDVRIDSEDTGGAKALEFALNGTANESLLSLSKEGSASANDKTLSWSYDVESSASQPLSTDLSATLLDIAVDMVEDVASDETSQLTVEVRARGKTIQYVATLEGSTIQSGSVTVDGTEVGQLSGSRGSASVTGTQQNADYAAILDAVTDLDLFALNMTIYALDSLPPRSSAPQALQPNLKLAL